VTGRPALGLRKRTGQVEEFDLFFTHSLKLHLIRLSSPVKKGAILAGISRSQ
jgi:hypothetical protein